MHSLLMQLDSTQFSAFPCKMNFFVRLSKDRVLEEIEFLAIHIFHVLQMFQLKD